MSDHDDDPHRNTKKSTKKRLLNDQGDGREADNDSALDSALDSAYDKSKFDHVFSGLSIWLEFEVNEDLKDQMKLLENSCGGEECGVHPFIPHVTILYNIDKQNKADSSEITAEATLKECWKKFADSKVANKEEDDVTTAKAEIPMNKISASDWMYFRYPKFADNGKGFGCSICLLLIEKSPWLEELHKICTEAFGLGDRDQFHPHMSLVYAPEDREQLLVEYTEKQRKKGVFLQKPITVKYLSLWSTQGRILENTKFQKSHSRTI
ncbi:MAG: hypothetical protein SGBAC_003667 [Bacillariaceae sp.]